MKHHSYKNRLFAGILVFMALGVFLTIAAYTTALRSIRPQTAAPQPPTPRTHTLPKLAVTGNRITRTDTGDIVRLKGVTTNLFVWNDYPLDDAYFRMLDNVADWHINLLGLFLVPERTIGRESDLDRIVAWAKRRGIYVYLMPLAFYSKDAATELRKFPDMMDRLAKRYATEPHILYGLWAEPSFTWAAWKPIAVTIADRILKHNADAILLMTGAQFGRTFDESSPLPYTNVVYDVHDYPAANARDLGSLLTKGITTFIWQSIPERHPVLIGEFGGVWENGFGGDEDIAYMKKVIDEANRLGLHYSAYAVDDIPDISKDSRSNGLSGLRLYDWKTGTPTRKGELIRDDLARNPPTDFLR